MSHIIFTCPQCVKHFTSKKLLDEHHELEHSKRIHSCFECGKEFTDPRKLGCHQDAHRRNTHSCKFCGEICNDEVDIYIHLTAHHKNRDESVCGLCSKKLADRRGVKRHIKDVHLRRYPSILSEVEFFCSIHSKQESFDDRQLQSELLQLDISQTFSEAEDKMSESQNFRSTEDHREKSALRHSTDNPKSHRNSDRNYACSECGKEFTDPHKLECHQDAHRRNTHSCKFCGEICNDEADIYIHLTAHHKNRDESVCGLCSKQYTGRRGVKRHIIEMHLRRYPSILSKVEFFCSIHSEQESFDDRQLQSELLQLDISQTFSETEDKLAESQNFRSAEEHRE